MTALRVVQDDEFYRQVRPVMTSLGLEYNDASLGTKFIRGTASSPVRNFLARIRMYAFPC